MNLKPILTEKAVMMIESQNVLSFVTEKNATKDEIKKEIESLFDVKVEKMRSMVKKNKKYIYAKLKKQFLAIDLATKLGMI